jgi:hypothetical protein
MGFAREPLTGREGPTQQHRVRAARADFVPKTTRQPQKAEPQQRPARLGHDAFGLPHLYENC